MTQGDTKLQDMVRPNFLGLFKSEENVVTLKPGEDLFRKGDAGNGITAGNRHDKTKIRFR